MSTFNATLAAFVAGAAATVLTLATPAFAAEGDPPPTGDTGETSDGAGPESAPASAPASKPAKPGTLPLPKLRPLTPGTDAGAAMGDDKKIVEEFKLGGRPEAKKKKLLFFELHGYLRWRTDLFQNLDLRGSSIETDGTVSWRDQNLPFPPLGISLRRPLTEVPPTNTCIYTRLGTGRMCNQNLSGGGAETLAGTNIRLRLDPTLNVSEFLRVKATIDLLDNLVLGSTPDGFALGGSPSADVPITAFSGSSVPPDGRNGFADSVRVKRVWGEVRTPFGELRFGRMPSHWGLGILANDGNCLDCDYGDNADRILFATKIANHVIVPAYDIPVSGLTSATAHNYLGQPWDLDQLDDVHQWLLAVARKDTEAELEEIRLRGSFSFNYGVYAVFRTMSFTTLDGLVSPAANPANNTLELVNARAFIPDIWLRFVYGNLRLELEAVGIFGTIEFNPLNAGVPCGNPDPADPQPCQVLQFGGAFEGSYALLDRKLNIHLKVGSASGDPAEGLSSEGGLPVQPAGDNRLSAFRFDRAYFVDMILFREILGTITGATYFNLGAVYEPGKPVRGLSVRLDAIYSIVNEPVASPGNATSLGLEFDAEVAFKTRDGFYGHVQGGILIPFGALHLPDEIYNLRPDGADVTARVAFTLQAMLGIRF